MGMEQWIARSTAEAAKKGMEKNIANRAARAIDPTVPSLAERSFATMKQRAALPAKHVTMKDDVEVPTGANLVTALGGMKGSPADVGWRKFHNAAFVNNAYANE